MTHSTGLEPRSSLRQNLQLNQQAMASRLSHNCGQTPDMREGLYSVGVIHMKTIYKSDIKQR